MRGNVSSRWSELGIVIGVLVVGSVVYWFAASPPGQRTLRRFNSDRLADLEVRMWQAYYAKQRLRLFSLLVTMLQEQYRYSWATATVEGFHLARAAATFGAATSNYEVVLPDLEKAYSTAKEWLHAGFDPAAVSRAEIAWWIARRIPGEDSPENVGNLMAESYALLYEAPRSSVVAAAILRARAAKLRDIQAQQPDWVAIEELLKQSYRELRTALN
jgi:hypothetical protein